MKRLSIPSLVTTGLARRVLIVPPRFFGKIEASIYVPNDKIYWIDNEGHVHAFDWQGRLIDQPPPPYIDDTEYE